MRREKISEKEVKSYEITEKLLLDYYGLTGNHGYKMEAKHENEDGGWDMRLFGFDFVEVNQDFEAKNITSASLVNPYGVTAKGKSYETYIRFTNVPNKKLPEVTEEDIEHDSDKIERSPIRHFKEGEWDKDRYVALNMWNPHEHFENTKVPKLLKQNCSLAVLHQETKTLYFFKKIDESVFYKFMWWYCRLTKEKEKNDIWCWQLKALFDLERALKIGYCGSLDQKNLKIKYFKEPNKKTVYL